MRVNINKSRILIALLITLLLATFVLSYFSRSLSPEQIDALFANVPGQRANREFDHTVKLPSGYQLSTKSNSDRFVLFTKAGKEVETDLAAFDIFLDSQAFHYPDNLDFPAEDKPRHIVIRLASEPQPWYTLYDKERAMEIGSLNAVASEGIIELSIYLNPQFFTSDNQLASQFMNQFALYALYALTHAWPPDSAQMISHVNGQIVKYYGHQGHEPTFYVE